MLKFFRKLLNIVSPVKKSDFVPAKPKRKNDTTKLTQWHYDQIMQIHKQWVKYNLNNPKNKLTTQDLTNKINEILGMNKSRTSLSKVWRGKVNRDNLPVGKCKQ